jgi:type I restriction enzyme S subunit
MTNSIEAQLSQLLFDKSGWTPVKFNDVVYEPKESVKDTHKEGIEHVVGLEHIESEDIHLRRSNSIEESTTFSKKFSPGDVLFGRRRAYLKKAARADFTGICSGDIIVMRAKGNLLPELLPFIVNSETFFDWAITHSAGGLSPRCKFKDLAKYEFSLPSKEEQVHILELFFAMDNVIQKDLGFLLKANVHFDVSKNNLVLKGLSNKSVYSNSLKTECASEWIDTNIGELLKNGSVEKIQDGNHGEIHPKSSDYEDEGIPFIMANSLSNGEILFNKVKKIPKDKTDRLRIGFSKPGDVLLSHKGTVGEVALVPNEIEWPYLMLTPQVTFYRVNDKKILNRFLFYVFTSSHFQNQLLRLSSQSTRAYVGITAQRNLKLVIPNDVSEQKEIVDLLYIAEKNIALIREKIAANKKLLKSLTSKVF